MKGFFDDLFAREIKIGRTIDNNFSFEDLGKKLKLSPTTLHKLEHKQCLPSLHTYYVICKWLGKDLNYYFKK